MTEAQEKQQLIREYEEMLSTMHSPGWDMILQDFTALRAKAADVRQCTDLQFAKGQLDVLDLLFGWKRAVEIGYEQLTAPEAPEAPSDE